MTDNDTPRPKKRRDVAVAIQGDGHNPSAPARVVDQIKAWQQRLGGAGGA